MGPIQISLVFLGKEIGTEKRKEMTGEKLKTNDQNGKHLILVICVIAGRRMKNTTIYSALIIPANPGKMPVNPGGGRDLGYQPVALFRVFW